MSQLAVFIHLQFAFSGIFKFPTTHLKSCVLYKFSLSASSFNLLFFQELCNYIEVSLEKDVWKELPEIDNGAAVDLVLLDLENKKKSVEESHVIFMETFISNNYC